MSTLRESWDQFTSYAVGIFIVIGVLVMINNWTKPQPVDYSKSIKVTPTPTVKGLQNYNYSGSLRTSGHDAGYEWAEENDIDSIYNCDGNSSSFNEGCEEYVCDMEEDYPDYYECNE